jgi:hypothetical protein
MDIPENFWCLPENYIFQRVELHFMRGSRASYCDFEIGGFTLCISADAWLVFTLHILLYNSRPARIKMPHIGNNHKVEYPELVSC